MLERVMEVLRKRVNFLGREGEIGRGDEALCLTTASCYLLKPIPRIIVIG